MKATLALLMCAALMGCMTGCAAIQDIIIQDGSQVTDAHERRCRNIIGWDNTYEMNHAIDRCRAVLINQ